MRHQADPLRSDHETGIDCCKSYRLTVFRLIARLSQESKPELHETCIPDSVWITIEALQHRTGFINHPHAVPYPQTLRIS